ncbi:pre-toxin TG domain-containing protein [Bacillus sonorensis]|uniref:pre-toxin TG domain-containing protein n=1 Tax=Bacillus sonorensis TaxID=119858 RepID=UPI002DBCF2C1|nr:pre-toxin TG domain-containing protein [Bacillus sonorensis]MEC1441461.1 pre-toxin TG domain-containing protein [Bacillus sonorensis]MEC1536075.1 pre-toxin TG domain-containing protein [Bacillus sonorensis]
MTGVDPVTGEKLSVTDRILSGVSVIPATKAVKVGKYVFKQIKVQKQLKGFRLILLKARGISKGRC